MEPMTVGVFSASLHPKTPDELFEMLKKVDLNVIQLGLIDSAFREPAAVDRTEELLEENRTEVVATFFGFDGEDYSSIPRIRETGGFVTDYNNRLQVLRDIVAITKRLGVPAIGGHAGFIPEDPNDPMYITMMERLGYVADMLAGEGLTLLLETGQETPEGLYNVMAELARDNVQINFDPANLILYGMSEPVEAVRRLGHLIYSVHAKDAKPSGEPDVWGAEQLLGEGAVDYPRFLRALKEEGFTGSLIIECEMGGDPLHDVVHARDRLRNWLPQIAG